MTFLTSSVLNPVSMLMTQLFNRVLLVSLIISNWLLIFQPVVNRSKAWLGNFNASKPKLFFYYSLGKAFLSSISIPNANIQGNNTLHLLGLKDILPISSERIVFYQLLGQLIGKLVHCIVLKNSSPTNLFYIFISLLFVNALNIAAIFGSMLLLYIWRFLLKKIIMITCDITGTDLAYLLPSLFHRYNIIPLCLFSKYLCPDEPL